MITVRHALRGDEAGILGCLSAAFEPFRGSYTPAAFADTIQSQDSLRARMSAMDVFVAADEEHRIIGTVATGDRGDGAGLIRGMAVVPSFQRRGVARRLLRRALDELVVSGCRRATLGTTQPLVAASRLYESSGFARTGKVPDFFGMPLHEYERSLDPGLTIREATVDDSAAILRITNAAYLVEQDFVRGDRLDASDVGDHMSRGRFLVAERASHPIASVFLQDTDGHRVYLGLLAVDPAEQGRGIGSLMMAAAERRSRRAGAAAIDILVVNLRTELPPFYRGRGFVPDGIEPFEDPRLFRAAHFLKMTLPLVTR